MCPFLSPAVEHMCTAKSIFYVGTGIELNACMAGLYGSSCPSSQILPGHFVCYFTRGIGANPFRTLGSAVLWTRVLPWLGEHTHTQLASQTEVNTAAQGLKPK